MMEPLLISEASLGRADLSDLLLDLTRKSARFSGGLPAELSLSLAALVRAMNCYYSNLIEGHDTHPIEIERALKEDYSSDKKKRDLQLEARAHMTVQKWIDEGGLRGSVLTEGGILEVHRRFCEQLPEDLLWVEDESGKLKIKIEPGVLRHRDVKVGRHIAVSPGRKLSSRLPDSFLKPASIR